MAFELEYLPQAKTQLEGLKSDGNLLKKYKKVKKALKFLAKDPAYPGLNTHKYSPLPGSPPGVEVWECYAENKTPAAYRIFFCYHPPASNTITIVAITPHP